MEFQDVTNEQVDKTIYTNNLDTLITRQLKNGIYSVVHINSGIDGNTYAKFYMDDENKLSPVVVFSKNKDEDSFKANKSGDYYSLSTSILFESLGFDFKKQNIICDLKREEEADEFVGGMAYRLVSRAPKSRRKTTASTTTAQEQQKEVDKEEQL